jgi:hypothetical protein
LEKDIIITEEKEPLIPSYYKDRQREYERDFDKLREEQTYSPPPSTLSNYSFLPLFISSFWNYVSQFWTELLKLVNSNSNPTLPDFDPVVKQRMGEFQKHIAIPFNIENSTHNDELVKLWNLYFQSPFTLQSPDWKRLGFQSENPLTDFRASGFFGLKNILYFAEKYPTKLQILIDFQEIRSGQSYPFAIASFNVTMMICELLGWGWKRPGVSTAKNPAVYSKLISMLFSDNYSVELAENMFSELYCLALVVTDREWIESKASIMEFPVVIANSQEKFEKLLGKFSGIEDLFSYNRMNLNG